ncbi:HNH endonuclease [Serratia fonticola]|uniref:HNH endonuclease signature motif containing protein n=1 Tax=Serratia fonticola TaxID=47917 RepID=UPI003AAAB9D2
MNWIEFFEYRDGKLYWKVNRKGKTKAGDEIKRVTTQGYIAVILNAKQYLAHRIIYEMHNHPIPNGFEIDHIDGNKKNNQLNNLRLVSRKINSRNHRMHSTNTSTFTGVGYHQKRRSWRARICDRHIGWYSTFEEACEARLNAIKQDPSFTERHGK